MNFDFKNIKSDTIARTIILIIALANQILACFGKEELPFTENSIYQIVSMIFTMISAGVAWWKNNSFTKEAIKADDMMKAAKANK